MKPALLKRMGLSDKRLSSNMGRRTSAWVFLSILIIGFMILQPTAWRYQEDLVKARSAGALQSFETMLKNADVLEFPEIISRAPQVRGAQVFDITGNSLYNFGPSPGFVPNSSDAPSAAILENQSVQDLWQIDFNDRRFLITVTVDGNDIVNAYRDFVLRILAIVMVLGLIAKMLSSYAIERSVQRPMEKMIQSLQQARLSGEKLLVEDKGVEKSEFGALVQEYNSLIESQISIEKQVEAKQISLEHLAHHDQLTQLPNRLQCKRLLKQNVAASRRHNRRMAVYLADLDNFKLFNDRFDQRTGDLVVAEIAQRLMAIAREEDTVGRLDGDEFIIIQNDIESWDSVPAMAQHIQAAISEPLKHRGMRMSVHSSMGIATFPSGAQDAEELLNNATYALQEAKQNGRGRVQMFTDEIREKVLGRLQLEEEIKIGIKKNEFEMYYQPKIDLGTTKVTGAEALIRWIHPERGFVSPADFIELAEETGLIVPLSDWLLDNVCAQIALWNKIGLPEMQIAINLSALQFQDPDLVAKVATTIAKHGIQPKQLELEITESAIMNDASEAIKLLEKFRELGVSLAIDDFGTGYSSLSYLKQFPVHTLKIDQAFVRDIEPDSADAVIVRAIIGLCQHFNMKVVAEGIETEQQRDLLREFGAQIGQGYLFAKPMPAVDFGRWVLKALKVEDPTVVAEIPMKKAANE